MKIPVYSEVSYTVLKRWIDKLYSKVYFFRQPCITAKTTTVTRASGSVVRFYAATALREWIWMKYG